MDEIDSTVSAPPHGPIRIAASEPAASATAATMVTSTAGHGA